MTVLLALLVLIVFVVPVVAHLDFVRTLGVDVAVTLILVTGIAATSGRRARILLIAMALIALAIRWAPWAIPEMSAPVLREVASLATFLLLAGIVAAKVFERGRVTSNRVMAGVVLYLLLGLSWAMVYDLIALMDASAFSRTQGDVGGTQRWVYYSFVTLTTVGFGDITPLRPLARSLTILEALVGQLYPAVLLARLVSLQVSIGPPEH